MLLAQISDLHIKRPGVRAYGVVDTGAFLERCVARLNALVPRPDAVLITGDLTDFGHADEYRHLRELLAPLAMPRYLMPGNHDERAALRQSFDADAYLFEGGEFVQYTVDLGALRIIALDSQDPGEGGGHLCAARLAWLSDQLERARHRAVVVALHHPPFKTGIGHMDSVALRDADGAKLAALLRGHANIERVVCGHVHRPIHMRFGGTIVSSAPSVAHQVVLDLRPDAPSAFNLEPPAFALHYWVPGAGLVSHQAYVDRFDGPYPFYEDDGGLID